MLTSARVLRVVLVITPPAMLTLAVPFVNRVEPHVFGLPFLLFWIAAWVVATPLFLYTIFRLEGRR